MLIVEGTGKGTTKFALKDTLCGSNFCFTCVAKAREAFNINGVSFVKDDVVKLIGYVPSAHLGYTVTETSQSEFSSDSTILTIWTQHVFEKLQTEKQLIYSKPNS